MALEWWQRAVIYQIYPRSFQDSNADGSGDLQGIIDRLDYLKWLGVNAIWSSPFFLSPHVDGGYDISDYKAVDPLFGTLDDFDRLLSAVHAAGMRLILDLVPNHTSDQHPWFRQSSADRTNPRAEWYHWQDRRPNSWVDVSGKEAWTWHEQRLQFYYHAFFPQQPDLNWRNGDVREAIFDVMRFWLDRGADGFRVDLIWHVIKDALLREDPLNPDYDPDHDEPESARLGVFSSNQHEVHDVVKAMRNVIDEYEDRVLIGEIYLPTGQLVTFYGEHGQGLHLPFNFQLIRTDWSAEQLAATISKYFGELPPEGWPNWVLGNHDKARVVSREGEAKARIGAVLLFMLRGTPFVYYGDEIGMRDAKLDPSDMRDPLKDVDPKFSRDPQRTPMQWSHGQGAGFTSAKPWLPVAGGPNVEEQRGDPDSMLNLYRDLIALRASEPALLEGEVFPLLVHDHVFAFRRGDAFLVAANFGRRKAKIETHGTIAICTDRKRDGEKVEGSLKLSANTAVVVRLSSRA